MKVIATYDAKSRFSEMLRCVEQGESFIITRNGHRVAELRPCSAETAIRKRGMMRQSFAPLPTDFNERLEDFSDYQ